MSPVFLVICFYFKQGKVQKHSEVGGTPILFFGGGTTGLGGNGRTILFVQEWGNMTFLSGMRGCRKISSVFGGEAISLV